MVINIVNAIIEVHAFVFFSIQYIVNQHFFFFYAKIKRMHLTYVSSTYILRGLVKLAWILCPLGFSEHLGSHACSLFATFVSAHILINLSSIKGTTQMYIMLNSLQTCLSGILGWLLSILNIQRAWSSSIVVEVVVVVFFTNRAQLVDWRIGLSYSPRNAWVGPDTPSQKKQKNSFQGLACMTKTVYIALIQSFIIRTPSLIIGGTQVIYFSNFIRRKILEELTFGPLSN